MVEQEFLKSLISECRVRPGRILLAEGEDPRVIDAADLLLSWGVAEKLTLFTTTDSAERIKSDTRVEILSPTSSSLQQKTKTLVSQQLLARRKTVHEEYIEEISHLALYQAGTLLEEGAVDCVIAGSIATTAEVIRAAIATTGLAPHTRTVSGSFVMTRAKDHKLEAFVFADCGVIIQPTEEQLVDIALSSAKTVENLLGEKPVVAFLSFSTMGSASHMLVSKIQTAAALFKERFPHIESEGELQFDAAYVSEVGQRKAPRSKVPGRANCFIFPDLNAGNIAYKITQRLGGFNAYGPILQGLKKPFSDLSRGASALDIAVSGILNLKRSWD